MRIIFHEKWKTLIVKRNLKNSAALEAIKYNGYSLQYVKEQIFTEKEKLK